MGRQRPSSVPHTVFKCIAHLQRVEAPHRDMLLKRRSMGGPIPITSVTICPRITRHDYEPLTTDVLLALRTSALARRVLSRLLVTVTALVLVLGRSALRWGALLSTGVAPAAWKSVMVCSEDFFAGLFEIDITYRSSPVPLMLGFDRLRDEICKLLSGIQDRYTA